MIKVKCGCGTEFTAQSLMSDDLRCPVCGVECGYAAMVVRKWITLDNIIKAYKAYKWNQVPDNEKEDLV